MLAQGPGHQGEEEEEGRGKGGGRGEGGGRLVLKVYSVELALCSQQGATSRK